MTKTHELDHDHDQDGTRSHTDRMRAPGRGERAQALDGPNGVLPSGILRRKARDGQGVADGAESAVSRASGSSGHALPDELRDRFESSLGTDLTGVRVHTSDDSAAAASAVGARAYAVGDSIHFASGEYDPSSPAGQHLLAHEVAHTVQQRGGSPHRQNKLAVSSSGDSAELEADAAANAMIAGSPFSLASAAQTIARKEATPAKGKDGKADDKEHGEKKWPKVKDSKISGSFLGGTLAANWAEQSVSQGWEKKAEVSTAKREIHKEFPIAPGIIGFVAGGIGASLSASVNASIEASSKQAPPPYNDNEMMMTIGASGGGSVEAKADGFLKIGVGVGVANVLSISAGAKLALEASAAIGVTAGGKLEAVQDIVNGELTFEVKGTIGLKAIGSVDIDVNALGESHTIASYTLGEFPLAEGVVSGGARVSGGGVSDLPPKVEWKLLELPPASKRQTRPVTPEERAQHMPVMQGASGAGPDAGPNEVEMSDQELAAAGTKAAMERLSKHRGKVVVVDDPGRPPGELVSFELDGITYSSKVNMDRGIVEDEVTDTTRPIVRVLVARVVEVNAGITAAQLGGAKTVGEVSAKILHGGFVAFNLTPAQLEFGQSAKQKRDADKKRETQQQKQGAQQLQDKTQSSSEARDKYAMLPTSENEAPPIDWSGNPQSMTELP